MVGPPAIAELLPPHHRESILYMALSLDRDMTHPAMTEYLESQPTLAPLAADLNDTVDGNVLIDAVKLWKLSSRGGSRRVPRGDNA